MTGQPLKILVPSPEVLEDLRMKQGLGAAPKLPAVIPRGEFPFDFVRDRTELTGTADQETLYGLLDYVRRVDRQDLATAAREQIEAAWKSSRFSDWPLEEFPLFADLIQRPETYRGKPITLRGHLQLHRVYHQENDYGLDPFHEAYLYAPDSQGHPATILFTENPDQIPVGEERLNGVSVTGYFLKLITYPSRDGKLRYAPLILARELRWREVQPPALSQTAQLAIVGGIVVAILLAVVAVRWTRRKDALARERDRELLGQREEPDFSALP